MAVTAMLTPLDGVTATTTSAAFDLQGADKCSLVFTRADHSAGSSTFTVLVSVDGTNYIAYNKLVDNVTNAIAENLTRVSSKALSSDTSVTVGLDLTMDTFHSAKIKGTRITDGTVTAKAFINYN